MAEEYSKDQLAARWEEFFSETGYLQQIKQVADAYPAERSIYVKYSELDHFDSDFAAHLFKRPQTMLSAGERKLAELVPPGTEGVDISLRVMELPRDRRVEIRDIRAKHLGKFIAVEGLVKRATEVRPKFTTAVFECLRCGRHIPVEQEESILREPLECIQDGVDMFGKSGCGRSGSSTSFRLVPEFSTFIDSQKIDLQEKPEELQGGAQPQTLTGTAEDDLTGKLFPGNRVFINGILRSKQRDTARQRTTLMDIFLEVNSIEQMDPELQEVEILPEDLEKIKALAAEPGIYVKLVQSISPTIFGLTVEKESLALQLFGGVEKDMPDGTHIRGDIHILLVGDPGVAKSQLLRYIAKLTPRGIYASGKSSSSAGLTAAAVKDEFGEGRWTLEAGALVLADRGVACIDELDKMTDQDRSSMHEAMEQGTISVAKAGITATLRARSAILGAANPKMGRFQQSEAVGLADQINLPPTLLSRFDLIFTMSDKPDKEKDDQIADHILKSHLVGERKRRSEAGGYEADTKEMEDIARTMQPTIDPQLLRKYVYHARSIHPVMSKEAMAAIKEYYLTVRSGSGKDTNVKAVPITARQLEACIRLSEASARGRLSPEVTVDDAGRAITIFKEFMNRVIGLGGGGFDIDVIATGMPRSQVDQMTRLLEIIRDLEAGNRHGAPLDEIKKQAVESGIPAERVESLLKRGSRDMGIYEPKAGFWKTF
jgi:replicative DNA helicase Mcm